MVNPTESAFDARRLKAMAILEQSGSFACCRRYSTDGSVSNSAVVLATEDMKPKHSRMPPNPSVEINCDKPQSASYLERLASQAPFTIAEQ